MCIVFVMKYLPNMLYIHRLYVGLARTVYMHSVHNRIFGDW
jgi:hypothetical protein